jgi:hypothetical protein
MKIGSPSCRASLRATRNMEWVTERGRADLLGPHQTRAVVVMRAPDQHFGDTHCRAVNTSREPREGWPGARRRARRLISTARASSRNCRSPHLAPLMPPRTCWTVGRVRSISMCLRCPVCSGVAAPRRWGWFSWRAVRCRSAHLGVVGSGAPHLGTTEEVGVAVTGEPRSGARHVRSTAGLGQQLDHPKRIPNLTNTHHQVTNLDSLVTHIGVGFVC